MGLKEFDERLSNSEFYLFWSKHKDLIQAVIGIAIVFLMILIWVKVYNHVQLEKTINEKCGWGEDDYQCYCEKSQALLIKNKLEEQGFNLDDIYVEMAE